MDPTATPAGRHIEISLQVNRLVQECCPQCGVYVATYTTGRFGQAYQRIEEESGAEFWSIKAWTDPPHERLKDPDVLVTTGDRVHFAIEVKWGAIPGAARSDVAISPEEWGRMRGLFERPALCRVRGPAVRAGRRYRSAEFTTQRDYRVDDQTRLILVTDVVQMQRLLGSACWSILRPWQAAGPRILLADINTCVGNLPALRELLRNQVESLQPPRSGINWTAW